MLSNAYFLANFRFDTAENEPAKNLKNFPKFASASRVSCNSLHERVHRLCVHGAQFLALLELSGEGAVPVHRLIGALAVGVGVLGRPRGSK